MKVRQSLVRWAVAVLLVVVVVVAAGAIFYIQAKRQHEFLATVSYTHLLAKLMEVYVKDHKEYPESLEKMIRSGGLDVRLLSPGDNRSIEYRRSGGQRF